MTQTALDRFWELVFGAIALNPEAFKLIQTLPQSSIAALYIVLIAGFSQAVGQGLVLFVNRVKPLRFILSLFIASMLFAFTIGFWGLSTWLVSVILFNANIPYGIVWSTLGFAYAPLMFSFLVALPYLGVPIQVLLSIWTLLGLVMGLRVAFGLSVWQALWCGVLGWVVFQIVQRSIGRPVAILGKWLSNTVAGTRLVTDMQGLEQLLQAGPQMLRRDNQTNAGDRGDNRKV
ncbi:YIP1 family protein [Mastigocladopsis repens]|uniref:YIP1 family protein n=1 Tax=Mastigocladopsis repens TaxID=221287 RepID=UPI00037C7010|nr:YIP1 family protein [Mastigocladopsis repens]